VSEVKRGQGKSTATRDSKGLKASPDSKTGQKECFEVGQTKESEAGRNNSGTSKGYLTKRKEIGRYSKPCG